MPASSPVDLRERSVNARYVSAEDLDNPQVIHMEEDMALRYEAALLVAPGPDVVYWRTVLLTIVGYVLVLPIVCRGSSEAQRRMAYRR